MAKNVGEKLAAQRSAVVSLDLFWAVSILVVAAALLVHPAGMMIR